ncbi:MULTISPECIES: type VII secretion protein EccB [Amycolatopsis]|uniref:Type VII secretion protein EccB n=1 Tax=Amycolatopsis albidoflavus TaxID=102226 RepID=A0ABW5I941_9PSEU
MQNKRDQLHAYRYLAARLVSALVRAEPDAPETPVRRATTGTVIGAILAVVLVAGFAVYGLISGGGNKAWAAPGVVVVEKETGNRYVYLDGTLRPVLNYVSAMLANGKQAPVETVSRKSLAGVSHGQAIGIMGAPDALPTPAALSGGPWYSCAASHPQPDGSSAPAILLGLEPEQAAPVPEARAVLVRADGTDYLVWRDERMRVSGASALAALGFMSVQPVPVSPAWLNTLASGPDLAAHLPDGTGSPGRSVGGVPTRIGQVLVSDTTSGHKDQFVVRKDGLAAVSQTDAALLLADPAAAAAYPGGSPVPISVSSADIAQAQLAGSAATPGYPPLPPQPLDLLSAAGSTLCVQLSFSSDKGALAQLVTIPSGRTRLAPAELPAAVGNADRVAVPAGGGALALAQSAPGVSAAALFLVTDLGVKYPVPSADVAAMLGFAGVRPVPVPTSVLGLIPTGPVLDPVAARTEWRQTR